MPVYQIKDGRGRGYEARVNENGQIATDGDGILRDSLSGIGAFAAVVDDADIAAGGTMLLVRNEIDRPFAVDKVYIHGGDVGGEFWIHVVTAPFTLAGTANTPFNMNTHTGGNSASLSAKSNETGNTQGTVIHREQVAIDTDAEIELPGVILGKGVALGVDQISEEAAGRVEIFGHYME